MQTQRVDAQKAAHLMDDAVYRRQWRDLKVRNWLLLGALLLGIPYGVLTTFALDRISAGLSDRVGAWIILPWVVILVGLSFYQFSFRCPRCAGWYFSSDRWNSPPWARRCLHCGLPRNAEPE